MTEPGLEQMSRELVLLKEIYETRDNPLSFTELCDRLKPLGTRSTWSIAESMLEDQGMIDRKYIRRPDGLLVPAMVLTSEAVGFAESISKHWREFVKKGGST